MKKLWLAWVGCGGLCASSFAQAELKGTEAQLTEYLSKVRRTVVVAGQAEVKAQADRAVVRLKVSTTGKGLEQAVQANQQARSKLLDFLSGRGIPAGQVQASKFSSTPKYGTFSEKVKSYRVDHLLKVTVQTEEQFQAVAAAVDTTPAVEYLGVDLERSNEDGMKAEAIRRACDNANEHRKLFEERLGLKLTVKGFSEGGSASAPQVRADPHRAPWYDSGTPSGPATITGVLSDPSYPVVMRALEQRPEAESGFGELVFQAQVKVEFSAEHP
jgi:uncharacterized protein YggE